MPSYYVDADNGNDGNDGQSYANAKLTLSAGIALLSAGDTLNLTGTFNEELTFIGLQGTEGSPIVIQSYDPDGNGTRAIIDGTGLSLSYQAMVYCYNAHSVYLDDLVFRNSPAYAFAAWRYTPSANPVFPSNKDIRLRSCVVDRSQYGGCIFELTQGGEVYNCLITRTNRIDGADEAVSICRGTEGYQDGRPFKVHSNTFENCAEESLDIKDGSINILAEKNVIRHCGTGVYLNHAWDCEIRYNVIHSCGTSASNYSKSGLMMAIADGAHVLTYNVSGWKARTHADVRAAITAGTVLDVTIGSSAGDGETSNHLIHHNYVGHHGYCGFATVNPSEDGAMTGNVFANNVFDKNGYFPGTTYGGAVITQEVGAYPDVFDANTFINNISMRSATHGYTPEATNTFTTNTSYNDTSGSVDKTTAQAWGYSSGDANALETAIDTLSGLHTGPSGVDVGADGTIDITDLSIGAGLAAAGSTVSALKSDGSSWGSIDDAGVGVDGADLTDAGCSLVYERGAIDGLSPTLTVNGTTVGDWFTYYGYTGTVGTVGWASENDQSQTLDKASSGTSPSFLQTTPAPDGSIGVDFKNGEVLQHQSAGWKALTTEDCAFAFVAKMTDNPSGDGVIVSCRNDATSVGWEIGIEGAGGLRFYITLQDSSGASTFYSAVLTAGEWYHAMVFVDRDESGAVGAAFYIDGAVSTTGSLSSRALTLDATQKLTLGSRDAFTGKLITGQSLAYVAGWKSSAWFGGSSSNQTDWASVAQAHYEEAFSVQAPDAGGGESSEMANPQTVTAIDQYTSPYLMHPDEEVVINVSVGSGDSMTATIVFEKSHFPQANYVPVYTYTNTTVNGVVWKNDSAQDIYVRLRASAHSGDDVICEVAEYYPVDSINILEVIPKTYHRNILNGSSTDDVADYINQALTNYESIEFPAGQYYLASTVTIPGGRSILGAGIINTTFYSAHAGYAFNFADGAEYCTIRDFTVQLWKSTGGTAAAGGFDIGSDGTSARSAIYTNAYLSFMNVHVLGTGGLEGTIVPVEGQIGFILGGTDSSADNVIYCQFTDCLTRYCAKGIVCLDNANANTFTACVLRDGGVGYLFDGSTENDTVTPVWACVGNQVIGGTVEGFYWGSTNNENWSSPTTHGYNYGITIKEASFTKIVGTYIEEGSNPGADSLSGVNIVADSPATTLIDPFITTTGAIVVDNGDNSVVVDRTQIIINRRINSNVELGTTDLAFYNSPSDANPVTQLNAGGLRFGPGGGTALDTVLDRPGVGVLRTTGQIRMYSLGIGNSAAGDVTGTTASKSVQIADDSGSAIGYLQVYDGPPV